MPKLQSPFKRALVDNRYVLTNTPDPYMDWFFNSTNLLAVEKLDGTNVSIIIEDGKITRAYNRLNPIPLDPKNRLYQGIFNSMTNPLISPYVANLPDGQHFGELIGPGIQENAMNLKDKLWIPFNSFGREVLSYEYPTSLKFEDLQDWMKNHVRSKLFSILHGNESIVPEGIVFHDVVTGQMAKLRSDMYQFWYDDPSHRPHKFLQEKPKTNKEPTPLQVAMQEHSKLKGVIESEQEKNLKVINMEQDDNPTMKEPKHDFPRVDVGEIHLFIGLGYTINKEERWGITSYGFTDRNEVTKQLDIIREALQEYPKLKEEVRQLRFSLADEQDCQTHNQCRDEIQKLKAENEELKKLDKGYSLLMEESLVMSAKIEEIDEIAKAEGRKNVELQQENNQLKQLKQRVEEYNQHLKLRILELRMKNGVNYAIELENCMIKIEQLLKDDIK